MHYWYGVHLAKDDKDGTWSVNKLLGENKGYNENINDTIESVLRTDEMIFTPTKKDETKITLGSLRHNTLNHIFFCGDCNQE